jgi:hypothetical protein
MPSGRAETEWNTPAPDVNTLVENINTINKNTEALLCWSRSKQRKD